MTLFRLVAVSAVCAVAATGPALPHQIAAADRPPAVPGRADIATIAHVLNRIGYGPRPGDVERVRAMGLAEYIDRQLNPQRIDDVAMGARLAAFGTLSLPTRELAERFFIPAMIERRARQRARAQAETAPDANSPPMRPAMGDGMRGERTVLAELGQQRLLRAIYSERQLNEALVDFWFNHFNVFAGKGADRIYLAEYERDVIRPRVFGKFRDLLGAVAESPAMLFYLDNWMSGRSSKLNENYARELLELHTLGVDGGYTQTDVVEVARAFTGWTIQNPRRGGGFRFEPRMHDAGEKTVLGQRIAAGGGKKEGERVLDIVAAHPSTARFIATKLARRFVADNPPERLIDRVAARFLETDGDLRETVRAIITSAEFFAAEARRAKVKTPLEFVASAARATAADVRSALPLLRSLRDLGMPLYMCQPPTGYGDAAEDWVNTGALVNRMNFAVALAGGALGGVHVDLNRLTSHASVTEALLAGQASKATRETLAKTSDPAKLVALALGSPEFQRR